MSDSSDEDHPYVKYGTPLPELSDLSIKPSALKSSVPVFEQVVTDEEGRRRFHGAFTGGFSAGYYNTVGTKEGWKPTTFLSSRSSKGERKVFKAEDFMDEEDVGDFGIAPKTLSTKEEFSSKRKRTAIEEKQRQFQEDKLTFSMGTDVIDSLIVPVRSNVGIKLLRSMGWKEGQGLGPHVVKRKKKKIKKPQNKVYGCSRPGEINDSDSDNDFVPENFKFAPTDMMPLSVSLKDDRHGIGYSGMNPKIALQEKVKKSTAVKGRTKTGSKLSFFGQAFGVGAFEDDDEDIYAQDSMSNYDAIMVDEKNPNDTYGWTKPLAIAGRQSMEAITFGDFTKVVFISAKKQTKLFPKVYPPPNIPVGFDAYRRLKLQSEKKRIDDMNLKGSPQVLLVSENEPTHLNADDRQAMLDDGKLEESPKKIQSVFDFISWEDRQKLEAAKRKPRELGYQGNTDAAEKPPEVVEVDRSGPLCKPTVLKPFSNNPEKLRRYEEYERALRQRRKDAYSAVATSNLTEWERKHERDEFARLSRVYLHLTTSINSKFTKASTEDDAKTTEELGLGDANSSSEMKVFGIMTHSSTEWHPDPLLCKRFNVPNPYPNSDMVGTAVPSGAKYLLAIQDLKDDEISRDRKESQEEPSLKIKTGVISDTVRPPMFEKSRPLIGGRWDKQPVFVGPLGRREDTEKTSDSEIVDEEQDGNNPMERPPMELFKSIFASSEEESSEEDEDGDEVVAIETKPVQAEPEVNDRISAAEVFMRPLSTSAEKVNPPEPFGGNNGEVDPTNGEKDTNTTVEEKARDGHIQPSLEENKDDYFGPALPLGKPTERVSYSPWNSSSEDDNPKSRKRHSKHKKHKKRDHKSKKKKKRKQHGF